MLIIHVFLIGFYILTEAATLHELYEYTSLIIHIKTPKLFADTSTINSKNVKAYSKVYFNMFLLRKNIAPPATWLAIVHI